MKARRGAGAPLALVLWFVSTFSPRAETEMGRRLGMKATGLWQLLGRGCRLAMELPRGWHVRIARESTRTKHEKASRLALGTAERKYRFEILRKSG